MWEENIFKNQTTGTKLCCFKLYTKERETRQASKKVLWRCREREIDSLRIRNVLFVLCLPSFFVTTIPREKFQTKEVQWSTCLLRFSPTIILFIFPFSKRVRVFFEFSHLVLRVKPYSYFYSGKIFK